MALHGVAVAEAIQRKDLAGVMKLVPKIRAWDGRNKAEVVYQVKCAFGADAGRRLRRAIGEASRV